MKRSQETAEAYIISLRSHLDVLPPSRRARVKKRLIKLLSSYEFIPRKQGDPPHPENIYHRRRGAPLLDVKSAEGLAALTLTQMQPYYSSPTQNRILKLIAKGLEKL